MASVELIILSSSDVHSTFYPSHNTYNRNGPELTGGIGKRMTRLKQLREANKSVLLFDSGDFCAGTIFYEEYLGEADIETLKYFRYDAISIGNHDSEKGLEMLSRYLENISDTIPILCSNLVRRDNSTLIWKDSTIFDIEGVKIGVFGLMGTQAYRCTQPEFQKEVELLSPIETYKKIGRELRSMCDLVICLSHSGESEDFILAQEPVVDILLGGHTHKTYKDSAEIVFNGLDNSIGGTLWHQPPSLGSAFSQIHLRITPRVTDSSRVTFEVVSSGLEWIDSENLSDDEETMIWFNSHYGSRLEEKFYRVIAHCLHDSLNRDPDEMTQSLSILGKLIASFVADTMGTSIGIVNRGGIKTGFHKDECITYGKASQVLGNNNRIIALEMKGILLYSLLKQMLKNGEYQVYGLEFSPHLNPTITTEDERRAQYDQMTLKEPKDDQHSTFDILINGTPLMFHEWYEVSLVDYMWKMALHLKSTHFPDLHDDLLEDEFHLLYRNLREHDTLWQEEFTKFIERKGILSRETLVHLHS